MKNKDYYKDAYLKKVAEVRAKWQNNPAYTGVEITEELEETMNAEEVVGYYVCNELDNALNQWRINTEGIEMSDQDKIVTFVLESLYDAENAVITTAKFMYDFVCHEYRNESVELNSLFFDFKVHMKKSDILLAYAALQNDINGDKVVRYENSIKQEGEGLFDALIPSGEPEFDEIYEGNCKDYLENLNGQDRFRRYDGDCRLEFIF